MIKNTKVIQVIIFCLFIALQTHGQQESQYSMYMLNTLAVNPAYAGSRDALSITGLMRKQWMSFPGAPSTQTISLHTPIFDQHMAFGLSFINDQIGPLRNRSFYVDGVYRIKFKKARLAFGVKFGADNFTANINNLRTEQENDASFSYNINTGLMPNFGTGIYYYSEKFYLGFSIPRSLSNKILEVKNSAASRVSKQQMHYYIIAGYIVAISENIKFKPSIQTKITAGAPFQLDANATILFKEKVHLGIFYRLNDAIGAMIQFNFTEQLRIAAAWDQTTSALSGYNNGTFEICTSYDFSFKKDKIKSPRYF